MSYCHHVNNQIAARAKLQEILDKIYNAEAAGLAVTFCVGAEDSETADPINFSLGMTADIKSFVQLALDNLDKTLTMSRSSLKSQAQDIAATLDKLEDIT